MATRDDRYCAKANRDHYHAKAAALGHDLAWKLAANANRKGYAYYFEGTCRNCAGNVHAGVSWSSCSSVVDVRSARCGGPGTYVLTEIEQVRASELIGAAIAEFGRAIRKHP